MRPLNNSPILRGRDIKRYSYEWKDLWLINTHNGVRGRIPRIRIEDYPAIKAHLDQFWPQIEARADQGDTPYNLRNCAYMEDFELPKIMYSEIVQEPQFFLDDKGIFFPEATTFIMTGDNIDYLIKLFHTRLVTYLFKRYYAGGGLGEHAYRYKKAFFENLPIPNYNATGLQRLIKQATFEDEIESLTCKIYGLTDEEIKYIESRED